MASVTRKQLTSVFDGVLALEAHQLEQMERVQTAIMKANARQMPAFHWHGCDACPDFFVCTSDRDKCPQDRVCPSCLERQQREFFQHVP